MCKHCNNIITSLEDVSNHHCFYKKDIYVNDNNVLFTQVANESNSCKNVKCIKLILFIYNFYNIKYSLYY